MRCGVMCVCPVSLACFQGTGRVCQTLALRKRHSGPSCQLSASCLSPARRSPPASRIHWSRTPRPRLRAKPRVRGAPRRHARGSGNARQPAPEVARAASRRRAGRAAGGAPAALTPPSGDPPDTHPSHWLRSARDTASPAARCPLLPSLPPSARRCWRRGNGGGASGGGGGGGVSVRWGRARGGRCVARATGPGPTMGRCQRDKSGAGGRARRLRRGEERVRGCRATAASASRGPRRVQAGRAEAPYVVPSPLLTGASWETPAEAVGCAAGGGSGGCRRGSDRPGRGRAAAIGGAAPAAPRVPSAAPRARPDVRPPALPKGSEERCPPVRAVRAALGGGAAVASRVRAAPGRSSGPPSRAVTCVPAENSRRGSNESSCGYSARTGAGVGRTCGDASLGSV